MLRVILRQRLIVMVIIIIVMVIIIIVMCILCVPLRTLMGGTLPQVRSANKVIIIVIIIMTKSVISVVTRMPMPL